MTVHLLAHVFYYCIELREEVYYLGIEECLLVLSVVYGR